jgi:hypothetical protein
MNDLRKITLAGALVTMAAVIAWPRGATADRPAAPPPGCGQWEVMLAPPGRITLDAKALPEPGKSFVEHAPAGWEPFAFTPGGALVYRRCAR